MLKMGNLFPERADHTAKSETEQRTQNYIHPMSLPRLIVSGGQEILLHPVPPLTAAHLILGHSAEVTVRMAPDASLQRRAEPNAA